MKNFVRVFICILMVSMFLANTHVRDAAAQPCEGCIDFQNLPPGPLPFTQAGPQWITEHQGFRLFHPIIGTDVVQLSIRDFYKNAANGDGLLELWIPNSEAHITRVCRIGLPEPSTEVMIDLAHYFSVAVVNAFDNAGTLVDTASTTPVQDLRETLVLMAPEISYIEVIGAEISVLNLCYICEPPKPELYDFPCAGCIDFQGPPLGPLPFTVAGPQWMTEYQGLDLLHPIIGTDVNGLQIADVFPGSTGGDGQKELWIPNSEPGITRVCRIAFPIDVRKVDVAIVHYFSVAEVVAFNDAGMLIDKAVTTPVQDVVEVLTLIGPAIRYLEIIGAEISVIDICYDCDPEPEPEPEEPPCEACIDFQDLPAGPLPFTLTGPEWMTAYNGFRLFHPIIGTEPSQLQIDDFFTASTTGDGLMELWIPNSEPGITRICRVVMPLEVAEVEIELAHYYSVVDVEAFDFNDVLIDAASTTDAQDVAERLTLSGEGIAYIEIMGAEISVLEICYDCEPEEIEPEPEPEEPPCEACIDFQDLPTGPLAYTTADPEWITEYNGFEFHHPIIGTEPSQLQIDDVFTSSTSGDGFVELWIPNSEPGIARICRVVMPLEVGEVEIELAHYYSVVDVEAFDEDGTLIDAASTTETQDAAERLTLSGEGIVYIEIMGAEISVLEICYDCEPEEIEPEPEPEEPPCEACIDFQDLPTGPLAYTTADPEWITEYAGFELHHPIIGTEPSQLQIDDVFTSSTSGDGLVELWIPNSEPGIARICRVVMPLEVAEVEIELAHYYSVVDVEAFDVNGVLVDAASTTETQDVAERLTLSGEGISYIEIMGAEISVLEICYDCEPEEIEPEPEPEDARTLTVTSAEAAQGEEITVHLSISDAADVAGASVLILYDPDVLTVGDIEGTDLISGMNLAVNTDVSGEIKLEMAATEAIESGSGAMVDIDLTVDADAEPGTETTLELDADTEVYDEAGEAMSIILVDGIITIAEGCLKGDVNGDGQIRSNDAILTLRIAAGLMEATDEQLCAADMNSDGRIRSNDAILILRTAAGLLSPGMGTSSIAGQITIALAEAHAVSGETVTVPLKVNDIRGLAGGDICITYDSAVLQAVGVSSDSGILMADNMNEAGIIRIAFANAGSMDGETLAEIQFSVIADASSPLELKAVDLYRPDAMPIDSRKLDGKFVSWAMPPEDSALLQNFPNPFNPETWIPYQLKEDSQVTVRIHNLAGGLVRELELGYRSAGVYTNRDRAAYWDGRNASGEHVASGVYFYSIQADDFAAVRKLIVVK